MAAELVAYNLLTAFPLSDGLIELYAEKLLELSPNLSPQSIRAAINGMIIGVIPYEKSLGIQNISRALMEVKKGRENLIQRGDAPDSITEKEIFKAIERLNKFYNNLP